MSKILIFLWIENPRSQRLALAQGRLEESIDSFGESFSSEEAKW
jgi:hypothetical protein